MKSIKFSNDKSQISLKIQKRFKRDHILLVIDNCANDETDDCDAEALLTIEEARKLMVELQKIIDFSESN